MRNISLPFLLASFRSLITLSRERALCPFRDEDSLELDESDEPLSDALESDEPVSLRKMTKNNGFICIIKCVALW